ncbi:MAG: ArsR family transcriptional regulator [Methanobacterium sp. ERen5]|nr:MAG: ArsR family transcriptional regulator [Methanobacterium sp. ERen5]
MLGINGEKSFSVTEMAEMMGLTQPAASQHLKILKTVNILHSNKQGNYIYYTFNKNALVKHKEKIDSFFVVFSTNANTPKNELV